MFFVLSAVSAVIMAVIEICFFCRKRNFGSCLKIVVKNILAVMLCSLAVQKHVMHYKHFIDTDAYGTMNFVKFFIMSLAVGLALQFIFALINRFITFEEADKPKKKGALAVKIVSVIVFFLGLAAYYGTVWGKGSFGDVTGDQLIINLMSPTTGTERGVYIEAFEGPVFHTFLFTVLFAIFDFSKFKLVYHGLKQNKKIFGDLAKRLVCLVIAIAMLIGGVHYGWTEFQLRQVFNAYFIDSELLDEVYVAPEDTKITFPEQKRNLIHIYLESLENSYLSKDLGGYMDENLMPELTELTQQEGIVFSDTDNFFGGPMKGTGTQWSIASMVNQTTGLPMKAPGINNDYGSPGNFLPGAYTLNDLLTDNGYVQTVMFGADARFGGLRYYYETHGDVLVYDYQYAIENGIIPSDYRVWWGFEDDKLYELAKEEITRLYETGKPFNFTMETADTHKPGGYIGPNTPTPYENSYANAIAYSTAQCVEFINWIKQQPFYENTTIVIIGDHVSMETDFFDFYNFSDDYLRTQYNCILNPAPSVENPSKSVTNNRVWCNWDMYPTILAAMGCTVEGERLGVGTNLFSGKDTIFEEYGVDFTNAEFEKVSDLYNEKILAGYTELEEEQRKENHAKWYEMNTPDE